jgi:hypothetical protein
MGLTKRQKKEEENGGVKHQPSNGKKVEKRHKRRKCKITIKK